ncbi:uncharacterized protein [Aquarana catesbeiana]|uniref:uncharacterized protein n=1 Tax=Aquarana catesbeiana TaxID=8400 RepID=UPI003CC9A907
MSTEPYCDGNAYNCSSEDAACASIYISFTKYNNANESYFRRDCLKIQDCNVSESISSPWGKSTYSTSCCNTDGCTPVQPVLKAANKTKNGVSCPACYSEDQECKAQYAMHCTGEEKYCLDFRRTTTFKLNQIYVSGCSTKNFCKKDNDMEFLNRPKNLESHYCKTTDSNPDQTTGHFTWCEVCHDYNVNDCRGSQHLCSPHEDVCVFERTRSIYDGMEEFEITKRCGKSHECNRAGSIRSSTKIILINTTCCDESVCMPPEPISDLSTLLTFHDLSCTVSLCGGRHIGKGRTLLSHVMASNKKISEQYSIDITKSHSKFPETNCERQQCLRSHTSDLHL